MSGKVKKKDILKTIDKQYNKFKKEKLIDIENLLGLIKNLKRYSNWCMLDDDLDYIPIEEDETYKECQQRITPKLRKEVMQEIMQQGQ